MLYTSEDFRHAAPPRPMGLETEISVHNLSTSGACKKLGSFVPASLVLATRSPRQAYEKETGDSGIHLRTGGSLYWETPLSVLETTTPTCLDTHTLLTHVRASETIAVMAAKGMSATQDYRPVRLFKRTGYPNLYLPSGKQFRPDSLGVHESYHFPHLKEASYVSKHELENEIESPLTSFLASRIIWSGTGMTTQKGYAYSQKAHTLGHKQAGIRHSVNEPQYLKPFFDIKGDRLEIRSGEAHTSDWAIEQTAGATTLLLRLIEHGRFPESLILHNPSRAIRTLAANPMGSVLLRESHKRISGIDHQIRIMEEMLRFCDDFPETPETERYAAENVLIALHDLKHSTSLDDGDISAIHDRIDWATKLTYLIDNGARPTANVPRDTHMIATDLMWEDLTRDTARRWKAKCLGQRTLKITEKELLALHPPSGRPAQQVALVDQLNREEPGQVAEVDWKHVKTRDVQYRLPSPYGGEVVIL